MTGAERSREVARERPAARGLPMDPTASRSTVPGPAPETSALAALLDCEADLDALERALLAAAVHPAWGAARRAWLARWDERRGWLEGWRVGEPAAQDIKNGRAHVWTPVTATSRKPSF